MPWEAYSAPLDWDKRLDVVRKALDLCAQLEHDKLIDGFNVFMTKEPEKAWISIRLDRDIKQDKEEVHKRLQAIFLELLPAPYTESNEVARMYEAGSRLALDYYELVRKKRVPFDDRLDLRGFCKALHGLLNNLGLDTHGETSLYFSGLLDRGFKTKQWPWLDIAEAAHSKAIEIGAIRVNDAPNST
jgi:hypothetical protein